ncbi:MAG: porin [Oxalobacter sp.]|nr:porin [Oxalobacter sp.]
MIGAGIIKAAYNHGRISDWGDNDGSASKYVLGYTHNLSKRVSAYVIASYTDSENDAIGSQFNPNYLAHESATAFQVGMTYRF